MKNISETIEKEFKITLSRLTASTSNFTYSNFHGNIITTIVRNYFRPAFAIKADLKTSWIVIYPYNIDFLNYKNIEKYL